MGLCETSSPPANPPFRFQELPVDVICRMAAVWGRHKARMQDDPYYKEKGRPRMALPRAKG